MFGFKKKSSVLAFEARAMDNLIKKLETESEKWTKKSTFFDESFSLKHEDGMEILYESSPDGESWDFCWHLRCNGDKGVSLDLWKKLDRWETFQRIVQDWAYESNRAEAIDG